MIIIFVGPPGAGKGTQANLFISNGWKQLSTGNMFRELMKQDTLFAKEIKEITTSGKLVTDDKTSELLKINLIKELKNNDKIILDGYPRSVEQTKHLKVILNELGQDIDKVINFDINEKLLIERLVNRRICPKCNSTYHLINMKPLKQGICDKCQTSLIQRSDDKEDKIKIRLEAYKKITLPIIDIYRNENKLITVNGAGNPKEIFQEINESFK